MVAPTDGRATRLAESPKVVATGLVSVGPAASLPQPRIEKLARRATPTTLGPSSSLTRRRFTAPPGSYRIGLGPTASTLRVRRGRLNVTTPETGNWPTVSMRPPPGQRPPYGAWASSRPMLSGKANTNTGCSSQRPYDPGPPIAHHALGVARDARRRRMGGGRHNFA